MTSIPATYPVSRLPSPAERILIGDGINVSPICIGAVGDPSVVEAAFDAGINFFFVTADMHWPYYEPLRVGLASLLARRPQVRDEIVVGAVSYVTQPEFCHMPFREVIHAVPGLRRLDISIIGGSYASDFTSRRREYARHLGGGIPDIRATGASFHDRLEAARAQTEGLVDIAFVRYNNAHRGAETEIFPSSSRGGCPVYVFKSTSGWLSPQRMTEVGLTEEHWAPRLEDHYRHVLGTAGVAGLLCAPRSVEHLRGALHAFEQGPLTAEEVEYMNDLGDLGEGRIRVDPTEGEEQHD